MRRRLADLPFELMTGPRQVGKTTLMGHLMADRVKAGTPPSRILYALLDAPSIALELDGTLRPLLAAYERFVLGHPIEEGQGPVFLFLDEVQSLPAWDAELKGLYDRHHPWMRVLATGSSSAALTNPPRADFAGRVHRSRLYPLKLSETLELATPSASVVCDEARALRTGLDWSRPPKKVQEELAAALETLHVHARSHHLAIMAAYDRYLLTGGYPAAQAPSTREDVYRFFETGIDTILAKDVKLYESVRNLAAFRNFLALLARGHGGKLVAAHVAREIGVDATTVPEWVKIAQDLFLVQTLPALSESFQPVARKAEKAYVQDPGVLSYLGGQPTLERLESSGRIGHVMEGALLDHLRRLQFNALGGRAGSVGFWDKPEVDLVVELPRFHLAVECKRGGSGAGGRLRALFGDRDDVLPIVATRDDFDVSSRPWRVPAWLLMLTA